MYKHAVRRLAIIPIIVVCLGLLLSACDNPANPPVTKQATATSAPSFPTTPPPLRVPTFGTAGQEAPTVKVLASVDPTLIVQFPLFPASIKALFPNATALVTVFQNPVANDFDTVTVDVQNMPPNVKFTVFFTELSAKPFEIGRAHV